MKKVLIAILICVFSITLCACSSNAADSSSSQKKKSSTSSTSSSSSLPEKVKNFESVDIDGNSITSDIFGKADYTIINFWGTYCNPCINEMPDLQSWNEELPDGVQMVGVVVDVSSTDSSTNSTAKQIVEQTGVKYRSIIPKGGLLNFTSALVGVPTTIIVDKGGNVVGEAIVGAYVDKYKSALESIITS